MPTQPDNNSPKTGEERTDSQAAAAEPDRSPKTFWKAFRQKMAISARLMGKEIYRNKLRWFDLRRADYRLGKKAYDSRLSLPNQSQIVDRLDRTQNQIAVLSQSVGSGPSFKEKSKAAAKGVGRAMKIQLL